MNAIPPEAKGYSRMGRFLDELVDQQGSALLYSTRLRLAGEHLDHPVVSSVCARRRTRPHCPTLKMKSLLISWCGICQRAVRIAPSGINRVGGGTIDA